MIAPGCDRRGEISPNDANTQKDPNSTSFETILKLAKDINAIHFKIIQCPFNILENQTASLLEEANKHGIGTLSNRPLNAIYNNELIRLVQPYI